MHKPRKPFHQKIARFPNEVPVFPLPNALLFPGIELPLYIYEPRYRQMLSDCQAGNKFLAISLFKQGWERCSEPAPSYEVIGVGYIRAVFENQDGTSNILLKGIGRARIDHYLQTQPYRIAKIRSITDRPKMAQEPSRLEKQVKKLLIQKLRLMSENPQRPFRLPQEYRSAASLSFLASFLADTNSYQKQELLELTSTAKRIERLAEILREELYPACGRN